MADDAKHSYSAFYKLVIRHEITKKPLVPAPHQDLMFSFVEAHDRSVLRLPIGTGKTFGTTAMALANLGNDVTQRGAIVSKTRNQAQKPLSMVSDYIMEPSLNKGLQLVYPHLRQSPRTSDPWTSTSLTIERPPGIRDPSLIAAGIDTSIAGSRLSWLLGDDIIDDENSATLEMRSQTQAKFDGRLMSRLDPFGSKAVLANTPWDKADLSYHLENEAGWPTVTMDIYGFVRISNAEASWKRWAMDNMIRPSETRVNDEYDWYRLRAFDPDPEEKIPLWPERYPAERIKEIRYGRSGKGGMLPREFARLFLCSPFDADSARCEREWVEKCKERGIGKSQVSQYSGPLPTYTGIDLGVGEGKSHDKTVIFTIALHPDGTKEILNIDSGRMTGPRIIEKILDKEKAFGSAFKVETNSAQKYIKQFAEQAKKDLRITSHTTARTNKRDVDFGVEGVFTDFKNGGWIIPCDENGKCDPQIQEFVDDCLYYQPYPHHTGDFLMAAWLASEAARRNMNNDPPPKAGRLREMHQVGHF